MFLSSNPDLKNFQPFSNPSVIPLPVPFKVKARVRLPVKREATLSTMAAGTSFAVSVIA